MEKTVNYDNYRKEEARKANLDRKIERSAHERILRRLNIPAIMWHPDWEKIKFKSTISQGEKLSAVAQKSALLATIDRPPRTKPLITIGSEPTDNGAMYLAVHTLIQYAIKHSGARLVRVNVADETHQYYERYPHIVLMHNIMNNATPARLERARDLLIRFKHAIRVLVVANCKEPEKWTINMLSLYPDFSILVNDLHVKEMRND